MQVFLQARQARRCNIVSVQVVHDVHENEHGQEPDINFSHELHLKPMALLGAQVPDERRCLSISANCLDILERGGVGDMLCGELVVGAVLGCIGYVIRPVLWESHVGKRLMSRLLRVQVLLKRGCTPELREIRELIDGDRMQTWLAEAAIRH